MNVSTTIGADSTSASEVPSIDVILDRARSIVPVIRGRAEETERERRISAEITEQVKDLQLHRLMQPKRFGGFEYGFHELVKMNFEVAQGCGSTAWCLSLAAAHNWLLGLYPLEAQQEVWDDANIMISGSYMPVGKCTLGDAGYWISGSWAFSSNCDNCDWYIVGAMVPPASGEGAPVPHWFLISKSQATIQDTWFSAGLAGTGSKTIYIDEPVFVPAHRALAVPKINSGKAPGTLVNDNPLYRLTFAGAAPFALCSLPVGMAKGAMNDFITVARSKLMASMAGAPTPMAQYEFVQVGLADASAHIDAAAAILLNDTAEIDVTLAAGELPNIDQRIKYRRDQAFAGKLVAHAGTELFEMMGANGGALSNPIQRAWRDINIAVRHISLSWSFVGAMYGQHALGLPPKGTY